MIKCSICGQFRLNLIPHLLLDHKISIQDYNGPTIDFTLGEDFEFIQRSPIKEIPNEIQIYNITFKINKDIPQKACLPYPREYTFPQKGELVETIKQILIAIKNKRSLYIWGLPGTGKDALFHAFSAYIKQPAEIFSIIPGTDIQNWFWVRAFNKEGTFWEEGRLLKLLRDGYNGIPYLILLSDFDRADKIQAEYLRLILDSIQGRIKGPQGETYKVLPGTLIVATGNSPGNGDPQGRCLSSNALDASLFDRFERVYQFSWMSWEDEELILKKKFPLLNSDIFKQVGKATEAIRNQIQNENLYFDFSHRTLCSWLQNIEDLLPYENQNIIIKGAKCWLDKLPDPEALLIAKRAIDPHIQGGSLA